MNDLETDIRRAVHEWAEHAPLAPSVDELVAPADRRSPERAPARDRRVFVAVAVVALVGLIGGVAWVSTRHRDATVLQSGVTPGRVTPADVAGQTLTARLGFAAAPAGFALDNEFIRDQALTAGSVLPTGPLGPVYAQYLQPLQLPDTYTVPASQTDGTLPDPSNWSTGVVTVLPVEQGDVVLAAAGHSDGVEVTVHGHPGVAVTAWSPADDNVVSWVQDGVAVAVVGTAITPMDEIERLAEQVQPIENTPVLAPVGPTIDVLSSTAFHGSWSLAAGAAATVAEDVTHRRFTGWDVLSDAAPLWNAFSTVVAHGTGDFGPFTVRATGSPSTFSPVDPMNLVGDTATGSVTWPETVEIVLGSGGAGGPDVVQGYSPIDMTDVRVVLSDGRTLSAPTYDVGRGWPVRVFVLPVPDLHDDRTASGLHVVRVDGLGAGGVVLASGPSMIGNAVGTVVGGAESPPRCPAIPESCAAAGG